MTNTKDGIFNNLSLVTSEDVKNVYDIFALKDDVPTDATFTENLTVQNTATTGSSNIYLKTNNSTKTARLYMDETGLIKLDNNTVNALQVFPNGVLATGRRIQNKLLVLFDQSTPDTPDNAINFSV
jgi:hypothetical protein